MTVRSGVSARVGLALLLVASGTAVTPCSAEVTVERTVYLMGTRARLALEAPTREVGLAILETAVRTLESTEAELSTWRDESLLGRLNRQPVGRPLFARPPICRLFRSLQDWHAETDGAFDPTVGALIEVWDLRGAGRVPTDTALQQARERTGLRHLDRADVPCRLVRRRDIVLDAGAFGKGAALDRLTDGSSTDAAWLVDLGGQVAVAGERRNGGGWPVSLAHPAARTTSVLTVRLVEGSLATSGGLERDRDVGGERLGHVLDPRTGRPITRAWSVTVWHERALVADILSTALYVMGLEPGLAWAEARGVAAVFLVPGASPSQTVGVRASDAFRQRFLREGPL